MKHLRIAALLERRIQRGDYVRSGIPAERELAEEIGASRVTLRKALAELEDRGLLERAANRRLVLTAASRSQASGLQLAFVSPGMGPSFFSPDLQLWLGAVENTARRRGDRVRIVSYEHWDDPALSEAIRTFDGVFLVTSSEPIPVWTEELLAEANCVVSLSEDLTRCDLPSIVLFPPRLTRSLLRRLRQLGHRRIDCFNIQGHNAITQARIDHWELGRQLMQFAGDLTDKPCNFGANVYEAGIREARQWIVRRHPETTAVFCITLPAAMGVIRAASEAGIAIGSQLSVCTIDCEGIGKYMNPPIASFSRPDPSRHISKCVDWFARRGTLENWHGALLMEPRQLKVVAGGSIGLPAP